MENCIVFFGLLVEEAVWLGFERDGWDDRKMNWKSEPSLLIILFPGRSSAVKGFVHRLQEEMTPEAVRGTGAFPCLG